MKGDLLIVSMPFKVGVGGFLRSYYVLPRLARLLAEGGYVLSLYVPANAVRTFIMFSLSKWRNSIECGDYRDAINGLFQFIVNELRVLEKKSGYSFIVNERVLKKSLEYNEVFLLKELKRSPLHRMLFSESLRPLLIHFFEKRFVNMVRGLIEAPSYGYSMHETSDAITALTLLSSKETKTAVLLQSDLGKRFVEKKININMFENLRRKTRFCGVLSVSPAPILESPGLLKLCRIFKVLVPGVAVDPIPLREKPKPKKVNAAAYYGRISKEKGIFDLLKAWEIVQREVDACLYVAGMFNDYGVMMKFNKIVEKYNLRTVKYLGYQERDKLFDFILKVSVLAYPSYRDSFSLTVLESLYMGLRVVAYNIPALRFLYQRNPNVELVPIGDFKRLASAITSNLEKPFKEDETTVKILNEYSSWEKVSIEEYRNLNEILNSV